MANLSTLLNQRYASDAAVLGEENLEQGQISVYYPATEYATFRCNICWQAPGSGQAVIEIWGAGGSGARMCCCGGSIPGQSGGYSKKTVNVTAGAFVTGFVGMSCGNQSALCHRGCSESTCVTICTGSVNGTCICMCAQGGIGGYTVCDTTTGAAMYNCFASAGFATNQSGFSGGCGIVCNSVGTWGCAYGGDVNCTGLRGCTIFFHCNPCCYCSQMGIIPIPPGIVSTCGSYLHISGPEDSGLSPIPGGWGPPVQAALNALARDGVYGNWNTTCWTGSRACGCYEQNGCVPFFPFGMGAPGAAVCDDVRDGGWRGGHGAVRIKFIG